ncbi:aspartoacylase [Vibrio splendidus]|uniref:aspartoacylase n=1 Tax=Vibrio splendidus TaxID=29497 RepID=UPI0022367751|nr:aspartoacylase [Vibrio splendidus]MCW4444174.1 aspartoacylase [Vibrio splendidus]
MVNVSIVGGTHGNEMSGIFLVKKWSYDSKDLERDGLEVSTHLGNPRACDDCVRYLDYDLNRLFSENQIICDGHEVGLAEKWNTYLSVDVDFVIDLHNTTSAMGATLILISSSRFDLMLGAYINEHMPHANIVIEDHETLSNHGYLASASSSGVIVEVGAQPHLVLRQDVTELMSEMTLHILDFTSKFYSGDIDCKLKSYNAFRFLNTVKFPTCAQGIVNAMVHNSVLDSDFSPLNPNDKMFKTFSGDDVLWDGDEVVYPHFINEAAYMESGIAMALAKKVIINT